MAFCVCSSSFTTHFTSSDLCKTPLFSKTTHHLYNHPNLNFSQVNRRSYGVRASLAEKGDYHSEKPPTPLLDTINFPIHMKNLSIKELKQLADEVRSDVIFNVSKTGGHLGSSLGVVELTVALHYVFDAPLDKILWDVGHQSYPHKILTGRRGKMRTLRQTNGLSGFTKREESEFDSFGAGHSSNSISAGLGMAVGRDLKGRQNNVVAVIGDGAMTAGQAFEAMNNAGYLDSDMIVILNDNKQVSLPTANLEGPIPPVGALSSALSRLQSNKPLRELREVAKGVTKQIGGTMYQLAAKVDEYARGMISGEGSTLFEELGLYYIGPVDGHNIDDLVAILKEVKSTKTTGPVLIHVITEKGRGYPYAERAADKYHGVAKFDPATGKQFKGQSTTQSYTTYFAEALIAEAEVDKDIVAIHAAMGGGTGLNLFDRRFPSRCFDVGIAEQHAVTFAAGLACEGLKPFLDAGSLPKNEDQSPLLLTSRDNESGIPSLRIKGGECSTADEDVEFSFPHEWFRFGLIPAGSTDAIVICTTGERDPITSALHIVLGKKISLDIAQVVKWKTTMNSDIEPSLHYTASFLGYGFYGDVITESEKYRWMGPKRYDFAGTKVFLRHRSYEAEISYLDVKLEKRDPDPNEANLNGGHKRISERVICRANCKVCSSPYPDMTKSKWMRCRGRFLSVGAAVISCRNERAPDGLVADAHLADGLLHLILIKNCPHALYLWHLTHLARKGGSPLDFKFVEHHKTRAFAFTSLGKEAVWNLDGEILRAHKLSAQVFRGLVSLFANGPEV